MEGICDCVDFKTTGCAQPTAAISAESLRFLSTVILSWLEKHDMQYCCTHSSRDIQQLIKDTLDLLAGVLNYFSCHEQLLTVVIKYANTFVASNGVRQVVLLHLLLVSVIVTIKMWGTENLPVNQIVADLFQLTVGVINNMEREFLTSLDYKLYMKEADITIFQAPTKAASTTAFVAPLKNTTQRTVQATPPTTRKRRAAYQYDNQSCKHPKQLFKTEIRV